MSAYTTLTKTSNDDYQYDVRYIGQSIGVVSVKFIKGTNETKISFKPSKPGIEDLVKRGMDQKLATLFEISNPSAEKLTYKTYNWDDPKVCTLRSILHQSVFNEKTTKSPEHMCENLLLREFSLSDSSQKALCQIQPVKLAGKYFQLTTPLMASKKAEVQLSNGHGGGIDILARVRHKDNKVRLSVIELKDDNHKKEPMTVVIQQAISYAIFLAKLLDSPCGDQWWKIFGFKDSNHPTDIDVVGIMPEGDVTELPKEPIIVGNFKLHLHALYFNKAKLISKRQDKMLSKDLFSGEYMDYIFTK